MSNQESFFKTVTSVQSEREPQLSKPMKSMNRAPTEKELQLYQAACQQRLQNQEQRLKSPLFQVTGLVTNAEPLHKISVKQTQFSNQPTSVFDFSDARKEQQFKPHCIKVKEPGAGSDEVYKRQLKTARCQNNPNPITSGDPRSEYNRSTKTPLPRDQITFVG